MSTDLRYKDVNLEIFPDLSPEAEEKFTRFFRPNIFIFMITSKVS